VFEHTGQLLPESAIVANMRVSEDNHPSGFHRDENGLLHRCVTYGRIVGLFVLLDVVSELLTFKPVHDLFHYMGWI
jgi:hypothetical protein